MVRQGEPINDVYVLLDGRLSVRSKAPPVGELAQLSSGEVVGEMSFLDSRPPSATVTAIEKSYVLVIPLRRFWPLASSRILASPRVFIVGWR